MAIAAKMTNKGAVPVFLASKALQGAAGKRVTYLQLEIETNKAHGSFNKDTGVFVVKTAGTYLVQFNGVTCSKSCCEIILRVNEATKANSFCFHDAASHTLYGSIVVSTLMKLETGDKVDVFVKSGTVAESGSGAYNRFSAILLSY